jgi:hypothetical protein
LTFNEPWCGCVPRLPTARRLPTYVRWRHFASRSATMNEQWLCYNKVQSSESTSIKSSIATLFSAAWVAELYWWNMPPSQQVTTLEAYFFLREQPTWIIDNFVRTYKLSFVLMRTTSQLSS